MHLPTEKVKRKKAAKSAAGAVNLVDAFLSGAEPFNEVWEQVGDKFTLKTYADGLLLVREKHLTEDMLKAASKSKPGKLIAGSTLKIVLKMRRPKRRNVYLISANLPTQWVICLPAKIMKMPSRTSQIPVEMKPRKGEMAKPKMPIVPTAKKTPK